MRWEHKIKRVSELTDVGGDCILDYHAKDGWELVTIIKNVPGLVLDFSSVSYDLVFKRKIEV